MEIIHVVLGKANPDRMNGVNKVVHQLATRQCEAGKQVTVWGITADIKSGYPPRNFDTRLFRAYRNKFKLDISLVQAIREKAGTGCIFQLHGGFNPVFYSVAMQLKKANLPFVFTPHGAYNHIALQTNRLVKKIYFRLFEKQMLRAAKAVHSLGASEADGLQQLYPNNKSVLIPYGFTPGSEKADHYPGRPFIIGYCGRIDIYTKGLDILLQAFASFIQQMPVAQLWIIGGGGDEKKLQRMIGSLGISKQVICWGSRFGQEKTDIMRQFTVFAHPSRNEGLPTAVLEAAAMGIPCVVTQATNTADTIDFYGAGETISIPDAGLLAKSLYCLQQKLADQGSGVYAAKARRMIAEAYAWNKIIHQFDLLYAS